jgi:adenylate cyclase
MQRVRKLATIMSIDIAGYSRSSERNETAAVEDVARLKSALTETASRQGGRIFSTAGDGAMLEFPTASAGLAATMELLRRADLPRIRLGLHLGEVVVEGDDLLGHGVNVAARLQALADSGTAMISGAMHAQAHATGDFALTPCGRMRLDKMSEVIDLYALAPRGHRLARLRLRRLRPYLLAGVLLLAAAIGGTIAFSSRPFVEGISVAGAASPTVAVLPFASLNTDPDGRFFAESISLSIANALSTTGIQVVSQSASASFRDADLASASRALNARYFVSGEVRREDELVRVTVRIEDARDQVTVLSEIFESPAATAADLPRRIATRIASIAWTLPVSVAGRANAEMTSRLIQVFEMQARGDYMAAYIGSRDLARTYPNEPMAHVLHAMDAGIAYWEIPEADFNDAIAAARASVRRARRLAPHFDAVYVADSNLQIRHHWATREASLRRGRELDPNGQTLPTWLSSLLMNTGRAQDAAPLMEAAVAHDPFNSLKSRIRIQLLLTVGDRTRAQAETERAERLWPDAPWISVARFSRGAPADMQEIMRDPTTADVVAPRDGPSALRAVVRAMASQAQNDIAAAKRACADVGRGLGAETCFTGLAALGELNDAFQLGERLFPDQRQVTMDTAAQRRFTHRPLAASDILFLPHLAVLRADPRFTDLAARLALIDYWRIDGNEPDFCAVEQAPVCDLI